MEQKIFLEILKRELKEINIDISDDKANKLYLYMKLLIEWNDKINLTAIIEPNEIITKHFVDSLTVLKYLNKNNKIVDCGTGAGFPGIPLAIVKDDCEFVLFDSLNKRIVFLNDVISKLQLKNVKTIHSRAEDLAENKSYRESFDVAVSRAVANMSTLLEYLLPFCKNGGNAICMKGNNIEEELKNCKNALSILNGKVKKIDTFCLPFTDYKRNIIIVKKGNNISNKYPRKQGKPAKEPL